MIAAAIARRDIGGARAFAPQSRRDSIGRIDDTSPAELHAGSAIDANELLAARYPVTCRMVGDDSFRVMARRYMLSAVARSPSGLEYGDTFAQFLRSHEAAASIEYVADIATLEMLREQVRRAVHVAPISKKALSALRLGYRTQL